MRSKVLASVMVAVVISGGGSGMKKEGALVIVGGGTLPADVRAEFFKLAGGKGKARLVVLPTATSAADDPAQHESFMRDWRELGPASIHLLHTRNRNLANDPTFVQPLRLATAVWISGGDQNRLMAAYGGTRVERELHRLLERGGVIGGTSAGAAVMSDLMIVGGREEARTGPGFGFLKGTVVDQHFTERGRLGRVRSVLAKNKQHAALGIDERTAAIIRGQTLTVMGEGTVTALGSYGSKSPGEERTLRAGDRLDLSTLRAKGESR